METIDSRSDTRQRRIDAAPSEVFAAMSDAARVARWRGPAGFDNTIHRFDFVPGGRCSVEPCQRLMTFVGNANEENLGRLGAEVQRGREGATR